MSLKRKMISMLLISIVAITLVACSNSDESNSDESNTDESNIIGSWKALVDNKVTGYLEVGEERLINQEESTTAEYIFTETQDGNFLLEIINPKTGVNELLLEGYFENKDNIIILKTPDGEVENSELIRVDNIAEEKAKDEKEKEEQRLQKEKEKEEEILEERAEIENFTEEIVPKQVIDGRTFVIEGDETVRLALIDIPENDEKYSGYFNQHAMDWLEYHLFAQTIRLERVGNDAEGNTLGHIWGLGSHVYHNVNKQMISEAVARVNPSADPDSKYLDEFLETEEEVKGGGFIWEQMDLWKEN